MHGAWTENVDASVSCALANEGLLATPSKGCFVRYDRVKHFKTPLASPFVNEQCSLSRLDRCCVQFPWGSFCLFLATEDTFQKLVLVYKWVARSSRCAVAYTAKSILQQKMPTRARQLFRYTVELQTSVSSVCVRISRIVKFVSCRLLVLHTAGKVYRAICC